MINLASVQSVADEDEWDPFRPQPMRIHVNVDCPQDGETLFRYIDHPSTSQIECHEFPVKKHTPKGAWIKDHHYRDRWVSIEADGSARYAYTTREKAWKNFCQRKRRQIAIVQESLHHLRRVEQAIKEAS